MTVTQELAAIFTLWLAGAEIEDQFRIFHAGLKLTTNNFRQFEWQSATFDKTVLVGNYCPFSMWHLLVGCIIED